MDSKSSSTHFLPHIAWDCVVFGFRDQKLNILIMEYHNTSLYALPGGFIKSDEDLETAVHNGLHERTGLKDIYLEQFHTFANMERYDPSVMETILCNSGFDLSEYSWMLDRFISIAHYALINAENVTLCPDVLADSIEWYPVNQLPELILDHQIIVQKALETLRSNINEKLLTVNLLPEKFTMTQLQAIHENILGEKLYRAAFQRKILASNLLHRHEKQFNGKPHKAPYLYSFMK